jgi:hypothetical protein
MRRICKTLFILLLTTYSFLAYPIWFDGQGEALIIDGKIAAAREKAIQDALLTLMYHGGASINALQVVKSGVLEIDKLTVRTNGEIVDMHLLSEKIIDDKIQVTVSADIYPFDSCKKDNYAKSLFIGPIQLDKPMHAQLGGLYQLPEEISQRLYYRFATDSRHIDVRHLRTRQIAFNNSSSNDLERQMLSVAHDISAKYDVQYILFGRINDMSDYNESNPTLLGLGNATVKQRNYKIHLYVIDAINNKTVFQKSYEGSQEWPFDATMKLDVASNTFWYSDYGKLINLFIEQSVEDIENAFSCQTTLASVVAIQNNENLVINLGQNNGLRKGDHFKLRRQQSFTFQDSGSQASLFNQDNTILEVIAVQPKLALLKTTGDADMANIQIRDILAPLTDDDF